MKYSTKYLGFIRLIFIETSIFTLLIMLVLSTPLAHASECVQAAKTTSTVSVPDSGEYSVWVRYKALADTNIEVGVNNDCNDMLLPATLDSQWAWTNKSTLGSQHTVALDKSTEYEFRTAGSELVELDTVVLLKTGQVCSDGGSKPTGTGKNCENRSEAKTVPVSSEECGIVSDIEVDERIETSLTGRVLSGTVSLPKLNDIEAIHEHVKTTSSQVDYYLDEVLVGSSTSDEPLDLDTTEYCNGEHVLKIVSTSKNGESHSFETIITTENSRGLPSAIANFTRFNKVVALIMTLIALALGAALGVYLVRRHKKRHLASFVHPKTEIVPSANGYVGQETKIQPHHTVHPTPPMSILVLIFVVIAVPASALAATTLSSDSTKHTRFEAESAQLGENTAIVDSAEASGGKAVAFTATPSGGVSASSPGGSTATGSSGGSTATSGSGGSSTPSSPGSPGGSSPQPPPVNESPSYPIIPTGADVLAAWRINDSSGVPPFFSTLGEGAFRLVCMPSHLNYDDPIVYPGQVGAAHLHMFFGNTGANAHSTWNSLRTSGEGTCQSGPINRSAYWAPALFNGSGSVVMPDSAVVYYKGDPSTVNLPRGLRYIAGYNPANPNQTYGNPFPPGIPGGRTSEYQPVWQCLDTGGGNAGILQTTIPTSCAVNSQILVDIQFPYCWDGRLDSANHRDHVVFPLRPAGSLECPSTHTTEIPRYTLKLVYSVRSGDNLSQWSLSSDASGQGRGASAHADWFGAWDQTIVELWTQECIRESRNCSASQYGDGTIGRQPSPWNWENPNRLVPIPARP